MNRAFRTRHIGGRTANTNARSIGVGDNSNPLNRDLKDILEAVVAHETPPLYMADLEGHLVYANRAFLDLIDLEAGSTANIDVSQRDIPPFLRDPTDYVRSEKRPLTGKESLKVLGQTRHFNARHFPIFDADDSLVAVGGTYFDVSRQTVALDEARQERQRFDDIIRSTSDWVWETDAEGAITFISDRITETLGLPPAALRGRNLLDLGHFIAGEDNQDGMAAIEGRAPFRNVLFEVRDRLGRRRSFHLSAVPIFDGRGSFAGYRGTGTDVSALRAAETEANESRFALERTLEELTGKNIQLDLALDQARAATEAKSEFLAAMSHELRTPLNAVIGFSEVMTLSALGPLSSAYRDYAANIQKAGQHLLSIIDDVLEVARMEGDSFDVQPVAFDLGPIINDAIMMISEQARGKGIDVSVVACPSCMVFADPQRVTQIFVNLFGNAVKFTPAGGAIGLDIGQAGNGSVSATVWDTGIGIPSDQHGLIFEKFHQVHDGIHSRTQEGAGLGLTISRNLARLMGGNITVSSDSGKGTRFTVRLPAAK